MSSNAPYPDPDASSMGPGPGLYGNPNGGASPAQQQQHVSTDNDLQMETMAQALQRSAAMMHEGTQQGQQMNSLAAHHHFQSPPRHSPQQMAQTAVMNMNMEEHGIYVDHDGTARKRSKVSRACDECRRKKIRCDATSENGPEACSSCKRTGARCQFSRQPMKRGPSKGYIKELADRLNNLESQIQNPHPHPPQPYDYPSMSDHALGDAHTPSHLPNRKRTHSVSEALSDPYARTWSSQDRGDFSTNGQNLRRTSFSDMTLAGNLITGSNEGTIKAYYNCIHPVLPLLSHETSSLNRLTNCPAKLRELFFLALECSVRAVSPASLPPADASLTQMLQQSAETMSMALSTLSEPDWSRAFYNDLVYSQSLLFLAIASDRPGPSASVNASELLGRLAGRISAQSLNDAKTMNNLRDQDRETFNEARRLFWVTFILDRFHASSRNKDTLLNLHYGTTVSRDDYHALGETGYHLARAADIAGQIAQVSRAGSVYDLDPSSPFALAQLTNSSPQGLYLNGQLSRFKESLDITELLDSSPPRLAHLYLRILASRVSLHASLKEVLATTKELLHNLMITPISPLHHLLGHVVASTLADLSDRIETQAEASAALKEMDDALSNGSIVPRVYNGTGWDHGLRTILHQKKPTPPAAPVERTSPAETQPNMAGLQHLAAAAVGEREGADAPRPNTSEGNGTLPAQPTQETMKHDVTAAISAASEAAAAQATAAAVQKQLQHGDNDTGNANGTGSTAGQTGNGNGNGNIQGSSSYDSSALDKDAF